MLSAQIDELRKTAEYYDGSEVAIIMRHAADTTEELRSLVLALDECRHSACNDCKRWSSPDGCSIDDMMQALGMKGE